MAILKSNPVDCAPGDNLREMTTDHVSITGETFPAGTMYRGLYGGFCNVSCCSYVYISIDGRKVRFESEPAPAS